MLHKLPDDPELEDMDPVMKMWMFNNWLEDYSDEYKLLENQGYLIGSFINPEMVKKILGKDAKTFEASDEAFEKFSKELFDNNRKEDEEAAKTMKRRRKRMIKE
jgi:hypothetical protein